MTCWNSYIGIPQKDLGRDLTGCDCWGLARLIYARELGIELPNNDGIHPCAAERDEIDLIIADTAAQGPWRAVQTARAFDLHLFRMGRYRCHIGVAIDARRMLHIQTDAAKVVPVNHPAWAKRLIGTYRHEAQL